MADEIFFKNRVEAGKLLAEKIGELPKDAIILALPRGGVVIGAEIARREKKPLDILVVKKIGHPLNPEYAIGAVTEFGSVVFNKKEAEIINQDWLNGQILIKKEEAKKTSKKYLSGRKHQDWRGKTIVLADDGLATGTSLLAAVEEASKHKLEKIIVAVPVAPKEAVEQFSQIVDVFVAVEIPEFFLGAVGAYYDEFDQVTDEEVIEILNNYARD